MRVDPVIRLDGLPVDVIGRSAARIVEERVGGDPCPTCDLVEHGSWCPERVFTRAGRTDE